VAVDSGASTCNHAIHEFFVSTSCSHLVAPLNARGQWIGLVLRTPPRFQGGVFVGAAGSRQGRL